MEINSFLVFLAMLFTDPKGTIRVVRIIAVCIVATILLFFFPWYVLAYLLIVIAICGYQIYDKLKKDKAEKLLRQKAEEERNKVRYVIIK